MKRPWDGIVFRDRVDWHEPPRDLYRLEGRSVMVGVWLGLVAGLLVAWAVTR